MTTSDHIPRGEHVPTADGRVVMHGLRWSDFESFLALRGVDAPGPRVTYLEGTLELMSSSRDHESIQNRMRIIVEGYLRRAGVKWESVGSWLLRHAPKEAGVEPDESYILHDLQKARPDLAIEIVWTSGGISKLEVYRRLDVREVWFWKNGELTFWILGSEGFEERTTSVCLPEVQKNVVAELIGLEFTSDVDAAVRARIG